MSTISKNKNNLSLTSLVIILNFIFVPQFTIAQTTSCLKLTSDLFVGSTGASVTDLQNFLKSKGHFNQEATGYYGPITQKSVELYQKAEGIVLNGTPETTGFGRVGPTTRSYIEKQTCSNSSTQTPNMLFGYDLNELLNYQPDLNYNADVSYNADVGYNADVSYNADVRYSPNLDFRVSGYEADTSYVADTRYEADTSFSTGQLNAIVKIYAKALNGQFLRGGSKNLVAVSSINTELKWISDNTKDTCTLSGDFKEKRLTVPSDGSAQLRMMNASGRAVNGDPVYKFKIDCEALDTGNYVFDGSDTIVLWVASTTTTTGTTTQQ